MIYGSYIGRYLRTFYFDFPNAFKRETEKTPNVYSSRLLGERNHAVRVNSSMCEVYSYAQTTGCHRLLHIFLEVPQLREIR